MYEAKIELEVTAGFESNYQNRIKQEVCEETWDEVDCSIEVKKMFTGNEQIEPSRMAIYLTATNLDYFKHIINLLTKTFKDKAKLVYSNTELKLKKFEES
ncbi:hypothetical protein [Carnobacterium maltaromaticum]|uniref:hypothetical protein n=1 Tax=Carnobacterium maltaromaticum TaxID=2751 RepID=UPI0012F7AD9C|nr:hypothetical protein [Carnobacterium maltaromaticum]